MSEQRENTTPNIVPVSIEKQMKDAYIDYSMSVIVGRALPDVRDGLKPVHRRILYAMKELGMTHNRSYKKSARIVGEVLGKYHPHGDTAVYDAMVRMAQPWSMRYMLIEGQGNFGNQDGDGPAAMRYTEARLRKLAEWMMMDMDKETVDFQPNFDDSLEEPTILPSRFPQLLINGSSGIAVGMATNMLPHNLSEVMDACMLLVREPQSTIADLLKIIKGPDFPTGGIIYGMEGIVEGCNTGRGRVVLRGIATIETKASGKERIVISDVPYQVNRDALCKKIGELVNEKKIEGIVHINNESNQKEGTRIVIDLKADAPAQVILNQLFKFTELQTSFGINNVALHKGRPQTMNLKDLLVAFIGFRHEVIIRRLQFELREAEKRSHILEGYLIALNHLDDVIATIRASETPDIAKVQMMEKFLMSEIQAKAVLDLRLQVLTKMRIDEIKSEHAQLQLRIAELKNLLSNEGLRFDLMVAEFEEVKTEFGDARKTSIEYNTSDLVLEDLIEDEQVVITISHLGYVKRTPLSEYRAQKRGGRGSIGSRTREEDWIEYVFVANTHNHLLIFTDYGRCYWLKVYELPEGDKQAKGRPLQNLIQLDKDDKFRTFINVANLKDEHFVRTHFVVLCTQNGIINKTSLEKFANPIRTGVNAIQIQEGDKLLSVQITNGNCEILLGVASGRVVRFDEADVRPTGRGTIGVKGIELDDQKDKVIGMVCIDKNQSMDIFALSENGYGKRTPVDEYRKTARGGKGVKTLQVTDKTGNLVAISPASNGEEIIIICQSGTMIRTTMKEINVQGRATQGVRLIRIQEDDSISSISLVPALEDNAEDPINETVNTQE